MEKKKTKKDIVKMLLKDKSLGQEDEEELLDLLIDQPISIDVDKQEDKNMTRGDKLADKISEIAGSWGFIIGFTGFLILWIVFNYFKIIKLDEFPFILLNLLLSCLAALQAPVIMMSQNRQAKKDSLRNQNDYRIDLKSELILEEIHDKMNTIIKNEKIIMNYIEKQKEENNEENK